MASFNYAKLVRTSNQLISRFGKSTTVRRPGGVVRVDGNESIVPASEFTITGVMTEYKAHEIDGSRVVAGDVKYLAKASPAIQVGDLIMTERGEKRVIDSAPLAPGGVTLIFQAQLRG